MCLPRRLLSRATCQVDYRAEQLTQKEIFNELGLVRLKPVDIPMSDKLLEYKDDLHLTTMGVEKIYGNSIDAWLRSIGLLVID